VRFISPTSVNERGTHLPLAHQVHGMDLGGINNGTGFCINDLSPFSSSNQSQNPHLIHRISPQPPMTIFEKKSTVLCSKGILWKSHHFSSIFLHLSIVLLCFWLRLVVLRLSIFSLPFVLHGLGLPFPCFCCEGFP
jgi:hypothetical protein